jgi:hypothetical protein
MFMGWGDKHWHKPKQEVWVEIHSLFLIGIFSSKYENENSKFN